MAGRTEQARAQIIIDGQQAETLLQQLGTRSKELKDELRRLKAEGKDFSGVQKELRQTESAMNSFKRATFDVSKVMQNLSKATMKDLSRASNQLKADLKGMERGTQEYINKSRQLSVVRTELNKVQAEINGTAAAQQRANGSFGGGLKSMMAWAGGIYGLTSFMGSSVSEYMEAEAAQKKVEQAVRQTGMAAGFTAKELNAMAQEYQNSTIYDADEIMNKVTAQLLSFPNVTGETFKLAQTAALDLATLLGGDLQSASLQLGKALQDPVKGLTALRRSGVSFTEEQKAQIKVLQESGRLEEAQAIILSEVNRQYGGQAEAAAQGAGSIDQLKNAWGDLKEDVGGFLVGEGKGVITWFKSVVQWLQNNGNLILKVVKMVAAFTAGWLAYNVVLKGVIVAKKLFAAVTTTATSVMNLFKKSSAGAGEAAQTFGQKLGKVNVAGLIGIITTLIGLFLTFKDEIMGVSEETKMWNEVSEDAANIAAEEKKNLHLVTAELINTTEGTEARKVAIDKLNTQFKDYLPNLLTEKSSYNEIAAAISAVNTEIEKKARLQALNNMLTKQIELQETIYSSMERVRDGEEVSFDEMLDITKLDKVNARINDITTKITALNNMKGPAVVTNPDFGGGEDGDGGDDDGDKTTTKQIGAYQELSNKISEATEKLRDFITQGKSVDAQQQQVLLNQLNAQKAFVDNIAKYGGDVEAYLKSISEVDADTIDDLETQMDDYLLNNREAADKYAQLEKERKDVELAEEMGRLEQITKKQIEEAEKQKKIEEALQQSKKQAAEDFYNFLVESGQQFLIDQYSAEKDEQIQIAEDSYNQEVEGYKKLLDDKKISEDEYNAKVKAATDKLNEEKKKAERDKALWSIAVDTAVAIAKSISKFPETFGMPFAGYAAAQGVVQAGLVMAQKAEGQYPVVGADDGKTYNASYAGPVRRTHIVRRPTVYLAGETPDPELIVSGPHFRNLQMNYPEVLRAIYATRVTQHATGNYPAANVDSAGNETSMSMLAVMTAVLAELKKPKRSYVVKKDIDDIQANDDFISDNFTG